MARPAREPLSYEHALLGRLLKAGRTAASVTTRQIVNYSSGHISNVENGHVMPSRDLLNHYIERLGCDRTRVMSAYGRAKGAGERRRRQAGLHTAGARPEAPAVTVDSSFEEIRSRYAIHDVEAIYTFDARGVCVGSDTTRKLTAWEHDTRLVAARYVYWTDPRKGVIEVTAGEGCKLERVQESQLGYITAIFSLDDPIGPDSVLGSFRCHVRIDSSVVSMPMLRYYASSEVARYAVRAKFDDKCQPDTIWWFREPTVFRVNNTDSTAERKIPRNKRGFYARDFDDINEEFCGIAWTWPHKNAD